MALWRIDPERSVAKFTVRHMMLSKVHGRFSGLSGELDYDPNDPARARVEARIPVATVSTSDRERDEHLVSEQFFDAKRFPEMVFRSKRVQPAGREGGRVTGDLALHGVTREVSLQLKSLASGGESRLRASASTRLNRKDFGLGWNAAIEAGGVLVGDEITVELELEFVK